MSSLEDRDRRGEIHLGDLARALAELQPRDQPHAAAIAACLGFGLAAPSGQASRPARHVYDHRAPGASAEPGAGTTPRPRVQAPPTPPRPVALPEGTLPSRLVPREGLSPPREEPPDWLAEGASAFPPPAEPSLARATLLPERTARHVLAAALATTRIGGDIHLGRLIAAVCRREPLRDLPRRREGTLQRGCHLLLDYSAGMVPFWSDLNALAEQVRQVVGDATTRVYSFDAHPRRAVHWTAAGDRLPWQADGRPVLVATDLGIQGRAPAAPSPDWEGFAAECARAGSPLVLLIPWPEARWPRAFPGHALLVHWGPRTTAGMVRRQAIAEP